MSGLEQNMNNVSKKSCICLYRITLYVACCVSFCLGQNEMMLYNLTVAALMQYLFFEYLFSIYMVLTSQARIMEKY